MTAQEDNPTTSASALAAQRSATVRTPCECQALLSATLDASRHVICGTAERAGARETAPAHSIGADGTRFDVAWLCPFCGRNTLRTFAA